MRHTRSLPLSDTLQGHKRWDKAVTSGYESIRRLTHENLLPALERCSVVVSRLRGLSRYQEANESLGLSTHELNTVFDVINCLNLMAHNLLRYAGAELEQFTAFSAWLRHEIDTQAADMSSTEDPSEKDPIIDHVKVLGYIQGAMTKSKLAGIFPPRAPGAVLDDSLGEDALSLYDGFTRDLERYKDGAQTDGKLPGLDVLSEHLERRCNVVFTQIAQAQRRNILFGAPIQLGLGVGERPLDMRMLFEVGRVWHQAGRRLTMDTGRRVRVLHRDRIATRAWHESV